MFSLCSLNKILKEINVSKKFQDKVIIALKSEELEGKIATYVMVFNLDDGKIYYPETKIGDLKFEGIEFV